jgi:transposase
VSRRFFTRHDLNTMLRLRGAGVSWEEVAERLERSVATCKTMMSRHKRGKLEKQFAHQERRRVLEIYAEAGYSVPEIAEKIGINYNAAYMRLRNMGFDAVLLAEYREHQSLRIAA